MKSSLDFVLTKDLFVRKRKGEDIRDHYNFEKIIGRGTFGICYKVKQKAAPFRTRAVKLMLKKKIANPSIITTQFNLLRELDHPSVIKIYEIFQDSHTVSIVMDYCEGGELFDKVSNDTPMLESAIRHIFKQMLSTVKYLHYKRVCHRDLKPENFMLLQQNSLDIVLIDFGISCTWKQDMKKQLIANKTNLMTGTSYYMAPEVIRREYSEKCDIWSLGVILYIMATGMPPFDGSDDEQIFERILRSQYTLEVPGLHDKPQLKDLIKKILVPENARLSIYSIENHPWLKEAKEPPQSKGSKQATLTKHIKKFNSFCSYSKLKVLISQYIASQISAKDSLSSSKVFSKIDLDKNGDLSISEVIEYFKDQSQNFSLSELLRGIKKADTDRNGKLSYNEFLAVCLQSTFLEDESQLMHVFRNIDKDKSGKISLEELKSLLEEDNKQTVSNEEISEMILKADKNNDGQIDFSELVRLMKETD